LAPRHGMVGTASDWNYKAFWNVCIFILLIELSERLCYYTIAGSQEFFLEQLNYTVQQSAGLNAAFTTLCYLWPLVGGYIADAKLGRYTTIIWFTTLYVIGIGICALAARPGHHRSGTWYMIGAMGFVAIGCGGIKPNISNFGADQYDVSTEVGRRSQEAFYTEFYVAINAGALVSYSCMTTICSDGGPGIPRKWGYFAAYSFGGVCMAISMVIFIWRSRVYTHKPPGGNIFESVLTHLSSAARAGSTKGIAVCAGVPLTLLGILSTVVASYFPGGWSVFAAVVLGSGLTAVGWGCSGDLSWVRSANRTDRVLRRRETADFLRILPTLITASLSFNALFNCSSFWYQQQACQMNLQFGSIQLNGSFFTTADSLAIVVFTPIILKKVNPFLHRRFGGFSRHGKLMLGSSLAILSVLCAAGLELHRRTLIVTQYASECAPRGIRMTDISAWWMVIPYALMGVAEVYVNPTLYYVSYAQTPPRLRSTAQAVCLVMSAASSGFFTLLTQLMGSANDLNNANLEYGYYASIGMSMFFLLCYNIVQRHFADKDFHVLGIYHEESDDEGQEKSAYRQVAWQRVGFFKDFVTPRNSLFASPGHKNPAPGTSAPQPNQALLVSSHGDDQFPSPKSDPWAQRRISEEGSDDEEDGNTVKITLVAND